MISGSDDGQVIKLKELFEKHEEKAIWDFIKKNPEAVNCRFLVERNILQMAITKKMPLLIEKLITNHPKLIHEFDRIHQGIFHHAVNCYDPHIMQMLITAAPELINHQRQDGKTALHLAMNAQNELAVQQLVLAKANIYIADIQEITPYSLVNGNPILLKAMCCWSQVLQPPPQEEPLSEVIINDIKNLSRKFALLKINPVKPLTDPTISADRFRTSIIMDKVDTSLSLEMIDDWDVIKLKEYLTEGGDPNILVIFGRPLILHLFLRATTQCSKTDDYDCMEAQLFYLLLKHALLDKSGSNANQCIQEHLVENAPVKMQLLHHAQRHMSQELGIMRTYYHQQVKSLETEFDNILLFAGLHQLQRANQNNTKAPNEVSELTRPQKILEKLCMGSMPYNKERTFNTRYISNMINGLLSQTTAKKMIAHIKKIWPNFDSEQKLIANFIIKELVIIDFYRHSQTIDKKHILFLLEDNKKTFPLHAPKLNAFFNNLFHFSDSMNKHPIYINHTLLEIWRRELIIAPSLTSFRELVTNATNSPLKARMAYVKQIANEINALTLAGYQAIRIEELYDKKWSDINTQNDAPNIMRCIDISNKLSFYIQEMIVSAENVQAAARVFELFILVAMELCTTNNHPGPNISAAFAIMNAFNTAVTGRLTKPLQAIDKDIDKKLQQLNKFAKPSKNFKWLRLTELAHPTTLPYLGKMLSDVTFIYDGNPNLTMMCEVLGSKLRQFSQLQRAISSVTSLPTTDIDQFLGTHVFLNEDELYKRSCTLLPPDIMIDSLSISQLINSIERYIHKEILPHIIWKSKRFEGPAMINPICQCLGNHLQTMQKGATLKEDIVRSKKMIGDLVSLINKHYPEATLEYATYIAQIHELENMTDSTVSDPNISISGSEALIFTSLEESATLPPQQLQKKHTLSFGNLRKSHK
ncbi:RasGEF domain-containing protein [Candidatus Berkiella aquae]|uniref:RasGEF domain protein n=1 Tax=Candidatus Berkiella aquae TaxID=295108 RepID=A0A0Q9YPI5_9GAMM|nr:RasGEF domain-containing protein [Candidatus Berkiella aquae]MCS5711919.1 hypothetical protein [Candidatus Berkiella aquae]